MLADPSPRARRGRAAGLLASLEAVERPSPLDALRAAALAGHRGDAATARALAGSPDPEVRAAALGALARLGDGELAARVTSALDDGHPAVRRRAAELAAVAPHVAIADLAARLADSDPLVAEAACWALGEREDAHAVAALVAVAGAHGDALVREAAVAALGAIGDPAGLPAVLAATADKPAVRRRAVLALAPFEGPEVEAALQRALEDRDWQVRQAAEDLLG
jgi:HEAT repeat protein